MSTPSPGLEGQSDLYLARRDRRLAEGADRRRLPHGGRRRDASAHRVASSRGQARSCDWRRIRIASVLSSAGMPIMRHDFDFRALAIAAAAFTAFVNLYSPQALLPELSREFGVGAGEISALMTACTAAIALTAPFTGALADVLGRKRLITAAAFAVVVPTLIMSLRLERSATRASALRAGAVAAADFHRRRRLCRRRMAAGGRAARCRTFCFRIERRRFLRPLRHRRSRRSCRLARVVRRRGAADAAGAIIVTLALPRERSFVRSGGFAASAAADAGAFAQSASARDLCGRLWRVVQLHRHFYLCELSSGGSALLFFADAA